MKKKALIVLVVFVVLVGAVCTITSAGRSRARKALADYKAQLRAQGEKLTFEDAGYPFSLDTNANLEDFVVLADRLRSKSSIPGMLEHMKFVAPGQVVVPWLADEPPVSRSQSSSPFRPAWEDLASDCTSAAATLAELRAELEHPPRYFGWNYTNPFAAMQPKNPFVQKRSVAQFLAADSLCALHEHQLPRAQADLHALTQLAQVHRGDLTLVSAMIRVAISGLALSSTWEALPAEGWDEAGLLALQRDWEAIDLVEALETGFIGERMFGEQAFKLIREADMNKQQSMFSQGSGSPSDLKNKILGVGATVYWRGHMDEDELFYLQHGQARVEMIRRLKINASGASLNKEMKAQVHELEQTMSSPISRLQYLFSAIAMSPSGRAFEVAVQRETERRMTITAIALKRFQLRNGRHPAVLSELVPQIFTAELIDPWSGKPFHYRLNADGTFTLYSVGADGHDDGGDPMPRDKPKTVDLWSGKDAVWPKAVLPHSK